MASRYAAVKKTTLFRIIFFPLLFIFVGWFFVVRLYHPPLQARTQLMMDTYWTIKIPGGPKMIPVIDKVFARLKEIDEKFNISDESGQVYGFNKRSKPITDPEIIAVIRRAKEVNTFTHGSFDITVGPILDAFGFYSRQFRVPPQSEIDELLKHVGMKYIVIQSDRVTKTDPKTGVDLGGIAKSHAIEEAVRIIKENGIKNALVDGGGDLYALGMYEGKPWLIGIQHPRKESQLLGELALTDMAVFSSGDYQRYFIKDGIRYHHIFDPKTGYPARGLIGTTYIYGNLDKVGGISSSLFIMGADKALAFVDGIPGAAAILVDEKQKVIFSKELYRNMKLNTIYNREEKKL
jgi:thiamine biosynthesis lipoprotein